MNKKLVALTIAVLMMFTLALAGCGADQGDQPVDQPQTVTGTVTDATMNGIDITDEAGQAIHFNKDDSTVVTAENGIVIGDTVDITYEGELSDTTMALTITVK